MKPTSLVCVSEIAAELTTCLQPHVPDTDESVSGKLWSHTHVSVSEKQWIHTHGSIHGIKWVN